MQYQGGKFFISSDISKIINESISGQRGGVTFVSLFCGACSVESRVKGFDKIICNDNNEYLIALLKGVQNGYELPDSISEEEYKYVREHKDEDKALSGFVGFGCSFGGKFFAGYARDRRKKRDFAFTAKRGLMRDMAVLADAEFICGDYRDVPLPDGCVIYADPPYAGTTQYKQKFGTEDFWEYMRQISGEHTVFISEQAAPDDFVCVWEKPVRRCLDYDKNNNFFVTEKLFVPKAQIQMRGED